MFCYQCEQTSRGVACRDFSVCGKNEEAANLQDLILHVAKGIAQFTHRARQMGASDREVDVYIIEALFTTVTNVNFDPRRLQDVLRKGVQMRDRARALYERACRGAQKAPEQLNGSSTWTPAADLPGLMRQAAEVSITVRQSRLGADLSGLQELLTYGLKGAAAYADHALILGQEDPKVHAFLAEALDYLARPNPDLTELLGLCLKCGEVNLRVMEMLDAANTGAYGHPQPVPVRVTPVKGKAILVSGHDLKDLEELLKQTAGRGINVYTHGEMLPAHGYPKLKAYPHLVGNYGGAWQDQMIEFAAFPGAILMTTNCLQKPHDCYEQRLFTCGLVAWPGVTHIANRDFSPVIEAALQAPGFAADAPEKTIMVGFGRDAVMQAAGTVIEAVKSGAIKRFFLIGGCDGARSGRNYFTEFAERVPQDCVVLTLGCGKYRFNKLDFGTIGGLPRLLDMGQCNDSYSAIQVAVALSKAFNCGVNDLPLSLIISWYEQKAVAVLLTLLHLGVKNIRLGPTLPAFVTPAVLNVLVEKFNLMPITTADADLAAILN